MDYPGKFMRASELAKLTGLPKTYFSNLLFEPGQNFARKMHPNKKNSPTIIDTEKYEKWHQKQIKNASRR